MTPATNAATPIETNLRPATNPDSGVADRQIRDAGRRLKGPGLTYWPLTASP
jgi:hypothetical protein